MNRLPRRQLDYEMSGMIAFTHLMPRGAAAALVGVLLLLLAMGAALRRRGKPLTGCS